MTTPQTPDHQITLRYFAWVREKTGISEERVALPHTIKTAGDLLAWMPTRSPEFAIAFEQPASIRVAIDRAHVRSDAKIGAAREIAFFPPVTGG